MANALNTYIWNKENFEKVYGISKEEASNISKEKGKVELLIEQADNVISDLDNVINVYGEASTDWLIQILCCTQYYQQIWNIVFNKELLEDPNMFDKLKDVFDDEGNILYNFNEFFSNLTNKDESAIQQSFDKIKNLLETIRNLLDVFLVFKNIKFPTLSQMNFGSIATAIINAIIGFFLDSLLEFVSKNITSKLTSNDKFNDIFVTMQNLVKVFYSCDDSQSLSGTVLLEKLNSELKQLFEFTNQIEFNDFFKQLGSLIELKDQEDTTLDDVENTLKVLIEKYESIGVQGQPQVQFIYQTNSNLCSDCTVFIHLFFNIIDSQFKIIQDISNKILDFISDFYVHIEFELNELKLFAIIEQIIDFLDNLIKLFNSPRRLMNKLKQLDFDSCYSFFNGLTVEYYDKEKQEPVNQSFTDFLNKTLNIENKKTKNDMIAQIQQGRIMNQTPIQSYLNKQVQTQPTNVSTQKTPTTVTWNDMPQEVKDYFSNVPTQSVTNLDDIPTFVQNYVNDLIQKQPLIFDNSIPLSAQNYLNNVIPLIQSNSTQPTLNQDNIPSSDLGTLYAELQSMFDKSQNIKDIQDDNVKELFVNLLKNVSTKNDNYYNILKRINSDLRS